MSKSMYRVKYKGKSFIGQPMAWDGSEMLLLRRNGKLSMLPVKSTNELEKVHNSFVPYSDDELRQRLEREFGQQYQITQTEDFLVVHPYGDADIWAQPFQDLYWRFQVYFSSRGLKIAKPNFPMVAVVYRTRNEFDRVLAKYNNANSKFIGFYSSTSNRIITYDRSDNGSRDEASLANNTTIIHEATHQTAYNTGVHSRFAPQVRWVTEGLATYFEANGVNNSAYFSRQTDRINRDRLTTLKHFYREGKVKGALEQLIVGDELFRIDMDLAYALSWGMTFYFNEKMPNEYQQFLMRDGARTNFTQYTSTDRARAFSAAFGSDVAGLESRMKTYFSRLEVPQR
ncbi:MAG: DUF1570 domain-containing protein [Planctomycetota bacterium]